MLQISALLNLAIHGEKRPPDINSVRYKDKGMPVVVWNIHRGCNMKCPHCYISAEYGRDTEMLRLPEARRIIDALSESNVRIVVLSGGEPFLYPELEPLLAYAAEKIEMIHISSNGSLISETWARTLKKHGVSYVGISIDGMPKYNDGYRGMKGGFEKAVEAVRILRKYHIRTGVRMTMTRDNIGQMRALAETASAVGAERFYVSHLLFSGRGAGLRDSDLSAAENRDAMRKLFDYAVDCLRGGQTMQFVSGGNDADYPYLLQYVRKKMGKHPADLLRKIMEKRGGNRSGEKIVNIDPFGKVHPDPFWRIDDAPDIRRIPLAEILDHGIFAKLKNRERYLRGKCSHCEHLFICRGSHRERAASVLGDVWAEDPACYI